MHHCLENSRRKHTRETVSAMRYDKMQDLKRRYSTVIGNERQRFLENKFTAHRDDKLSYFVNR